MITLPIILHTEDSEEIAESTVPELELLGVQVESFRQNELALEAAKKKSVLGIPYYDAVLADYNTDSNMRGEELIAELIKSSIDGKPLVKEILVLSSSADRIAILDKLRAALARQNLDNAQISDYMQRVQVFDKTFERRLAELYVALHALHPNEAQEINRADMILWAGFKMNSRGDIRSTGLVRL